MQRKTSKEVKAEGSLGFSNHALVKFMILRNASMAKSRVRTLNFRKGNFRLFEELLDGVCREILLREDGFRNGTELAVA